jgi:hypothetical protein
MDGLGSDGRDSLPHFACCKYIRVCHSRHLSFWYCVSVRLTYSLPLAHALTEWSNPASVGVLGLAARQEGAEAVQCGELEVARPRAYCAAAVGPYEMDSPAVAAVVEIEEDEG